MQNTNSGKRNSRPDTDVPGKKQKTNSSLLELCEREEWNVIIESAPDMINVWDFEERDADNNTPIHICCSEGALNVLQHLHQAKKLNFESKGEHGSSCVALAATNGHLETIKWLIENGCSINETDLYGNSCVLLASSSGHLETVKWLSENGFSIHERNKDQSNCILQAKWFNGF